jgi:uncharacterized membrane protein YdjX (TVP38/TMEM64 family)
MNAKLSKNADIKNNIFEYGELSKKKSGIWLIFVVMTILVLIIIYLAYLKNLDFIKNSFINHFVVHIVSQVSQTNYLGSFYIAFVGGLFFIYMPIEALFYRALFINESVFVVLVLFMLGLTISYSLDYYIGKNFSLVFKKFVSPKQFYKMKGYINKYGAFAVFFINALPFLPSQLTTFMLGVFRYNKYRLFIFAFSGWLLKLLVLIISYKYLF